MAEVSLITSLCFRIVLSKLNAVYLTWVVPSSEVCETKD